MLVLAATPIGDAADASPALVRALETADVVAAEDTRRLRDLCRRIGVTVEGRVASIAPATGANFSLLPPENATGNFTKIVQRVPVRIDLPAGAVADEHLRAGLSVMVSVDSRPGEAATQTAAR